MRYILMIVGLLVAIAVFTAPEPVQAHDKVGFGSVQVRSFGQPINPFFHQRGVFVQSVHAPPVVVFQQPGHFGRQVQFQQFSRGRSIQSFNRRPAVQINVNQRRGFFRR